MKLINRHPNESNWSYIGPFGWCFFSYRGSIWHKLKTFELNLSFAYWPRKRGQESWANTHRWDCRISPRQLTLWHGYEFVAWWFPTNDATLDWSKAGFAPRMIFSRPDFRDVAPEE